MIASTKTLLFSDQAKPTRDHSIKTAKITEQTLHNLKNIKISHSATPLQFPNQKFPILFAYATKFSLSIKLHPAEFSMFIQIVFLSL
jgi:hypothetical protein